MNHEGRVCVLNWQLTTTVFAGDAGWMRAASVIRVGADAQPAATTLSRMAISTAARFIVRSFAIRLTYLDRSAAEVVAPERELRGTAGVVAPERELRGIAGMVAPERESWRGTGRRVSGGFSRPRHRERRRR